MRSLLDMNVTIALLDPDHIFHERAHTWWTAEKRFGWASCPLTETGVVRIMSNPGYSAAARFTPADLIGRLRLFSARTDHEFWPDSVSIRDERVLVAERVHGARQLTDLYLLALAVNRGGRLATFDRSIPLSAVPSAAPHHVAMI